MEKTLDLTQNLYDKKPISWLIRELEKQLADGKDYVELSTETEWGNTSQILLFTQS